MNFSSLVFSFTSLLGYLILQGMNLQGIEGELIWIFLGIGGVYLLFGLFGKEDKKEKIEEYIPDSIEVVDKEEDKNLNKSKEGNKNGV